MSVHQEIKPEQILYEDNHLLVVNKAPGVLSQGDISGDPNLLDMAKVYIKKKYNKPGNVFLGLVHRLDRPTSGVIVFARTSKAASRLSRYFRKHRIDKTYLALIEGIPPEKGTYTDYIRRDKIAGFVTDNPMDQSAELRFHRLKTLGDISLIEIDLLTGRHHQIRIQFSHRGHPVLGDRRYGSRRDWPGEGIALHAWKLTILHPVTREKMLFTASPPEMWTPFI
ncbi:MAG: RluA family pseudouridine synthase [Candidatus Marinimicrobia bacterium]|nr:RluA family pseudouridine synthase [Candidatus Neomarinimicrobiota bacterium]